MDERDTTTGCFIEILQAAQAVCQEKKSVTDLHATVGALFWLALTHGTRMGSDISTWWRPPLNISEQRADLGLDTLLSAAAHFNLLPLTKLLITEGHCPTSHNFLFAPPTQVATQAGNINILQLFQEQLLDSTFESFLVTGAAIRGDIDNVKLALRLPPRTGQSEGSGDDASNQQLRSIEWISKSGLSILGARRYASSPKVYDYLTSFLAPWPTWLEKSHEDLIRHAEFGNVSMVRHLLHLSVPVKVSGYIKSPLVMACRGGHNDIADLLLEHGADPNYVAQKFYPIFPLR